MPRRLLAEGQNFALLATANKDGSPQVTPVWIDFDGTYVLVNSEQRRRKTRNVKRNPRVAVTILEPGNPYQYMEIRGRVAEVTTDGAAAHIDKMAKKYLGQDKYPYNQPDDVRVIFKIEPERVHYGN
jgi:PPOX class probable F420-dependent enzyme